MNAEHLPLCECGHLEQHHRTGCIHCDCESYRHISSASLPKSKVPKSTLSEPEELLAMQIKGSEVIPEPKRGYRFHPLNRRWSCDFAWPRLNVHQELAAPGVVVEIEGWGHKTASRFASDLRKYRAVVALGWELYRFAPMEVKAGIAFDFLEALFSEADMLEMTK